MSFHMTKRSQLRRQDPDDLVPADCRQSPQRFQKHRPKTDKGKQRSRGNALRHGLTAETVIGTLEDALQGVRGGRGSGFRCPFAAKRELVLRLAGLLWRLRRATRIEVGLLDIQATQLGDLRGYDTTPRQVRQAIFGQPVIQSGTESSLVGEQGAAGELGNADPANDHLARC
jgi:hypothetical protein